MKIVKVGLAPVANADARILVLGTLPSDVSRTARQYYANVSHNDFWKMIDTIFNVASPVSYEKRLKALKVNKIALWDVCAEAQREGSLDSAIKLHSVRTNDFSTFLCSHNFERICFNGKKAADLYRNNVLHQLTPEHRAIEATILLSSSHACTKPFEEKVRMWRPALTVSV